jgi:hypothetical protein
MQERKRIEQELATLALAVGAKSNEEATAALWDLYTQFAILTAEERVRTEISSKQESLQAQLEARLSALQNELAKARTKAPTAEDVRVEELAPEDSAPEVVEIAPAPVETVPEVVDTPDEVPALAPDPAPAEVAPVQTTIEEVPAAEEAPVEAEVAAPETPANVVERAQQGGEKKSLNDRFAQKALSFGLNDRIGFTKALFEGSGEDFNRVVSQLNTMNTLGEAEEFLNTHIAPEYGWDAQEEAAERFKAAVAQRFS